MSILTDISENLQRGKAKIVKELVQQAIDEGIPVQQILDEGLLSGMGVIGEKFKNNEVFVPEVLIAARAMNAGVGILKPYLVDAGVESKGKAVIGTVKGDLHDIGKNLVKMMMEGRGLTVIDLGVDVSPRRFLEEAVGSHAQIVCLSGIMPHSEEDMRAVVEEFEMKGIRDQFYFMVGGYFLTERQAKAIGADCYTEDACNCAEKACRYLNKKDRRKKNH